MPIVVDEIAKKAKNVIVQELVESAVSGVAFSQHPTKDMPRVIVIDAVEGSNERLMSGEQDAVRAFAWADVHLVPDAYPIPIHGFVELKQLILQIATLFRHPVDVEWAWDGHQVWILQARPITRLPAQNTLDHEEARVMRLFALRPDLVLDRNDFAESAPRPDEKTLAMIRGLYREQGPFHRAAIKLGLTYKAKDAQEYF